VRSDSERPRGAAEGAQAAAASGTQILAERADVSSEADVDVGSVATTHNALALLAAPAARAGKHMVVEKPGARCAAELDPAPSRRDQQECWWRWESQLLSGIPQSS
jgi:predicted dehydrogenase